jgi:hypothetical protein
MPGATTAIAGTIAGRPAELRGAALSAGLPSAPPPQGEEGGGAFFWHGGAKNAAKWGGQPCSLGSPAAWAWAALQPGSLGQPAWPDRHTTHLCWPPPAPLPQFDERMLIVQVGTQMAVLQDSPRWSSLWRRMRKGLCRCCGADFNIKAASSTTTRWAKLPGTGPPCTEPTCTSPGHHRGPARQDRARGVVFALRRGVVLDWSDWPRTFTAAAATGAHERPACAVMRCGGSPVGSAVFGRWWLVVGGWWWASLS